jgi:hypothetical protein
MADSATRGTLASVVNPDVDTDDRICTEATSTWRKSIVPIRVLQNWK